MIQEKNAAKQINLNDEVSPQENVVESEGADLKDRIDFIFKVIGRYDFYINTTNTKGSLILAWNGLLIGSVLLKYDSILSLFPHPKAQIFASIFLSLATLAALISNVIAFQVVFPFLQSSSQYLEAKSLIFFGSVANLKPEEYFQRITENSNEDMVQDLSDQAVTLAKGLQGKMIRLRKSIRVIYGELIFLAILVAGKLLISFS